MSNGGPENDMWKSSVASSSSSRLATLKSLVPATQRDVMRAFFARRVPSSSSSSLSSSQDSRSLMVPGNLQDRKLSWREWAGDKIRGRGSGISDAVEKVSLFPGWAARRYHDPEMEGKEAAEFALEIFVSGFAASYVPPESATRSQRAFMRLAKAYAALPKIPSPTYEPSPSSSVTWSRPLSHSTEDLLKTMKLPPTPSNITEEYEVAKLEKQFQKAEVDMETESLASTESDSVPSSLNDTPPSLAPGSSTGVSYEIATGQFTSSLMDVTRLHANLSARLHPFWSRALSNRMLRLSVYSVPPRSQTSFPDEEAFKDDYDPIRETVFEHHLLTDAQGAFEARLRIPWESICVHPGALHVAFGDTDQDAELFVCAELLPPSNPANPSITGVATACSVQAITLSQSQIRLISDIDDTIKLSNIIGGARTVFRNVFVKHLEELVINGMGDWYTRMWSRGVRFHYVSNSPFELLPVINEFINVSKLPRGSIKLKSYAGRSLFNGLLSTPATRKRSGILDILNAFSNSRFILVGDSGEQDLELYAQLAAERHSQILAVFIRDARGKDAIPISDPTGEEIKRCPPPSRSMSRASSTSGTGLLPPAPTTGLGKEVRSNTMPTSFDTTPTQKSIPRMIESKSLSPSYLDTSPQDYMSAGSAMPVSSSSRKRQLGPGSRSSSVPLAPAPIPGLPSTFFDSDLTITTSSSPASSRATSRSASPSPSPLSATSSIGGLRFPGSLTESEIANLPPSERKRYKLQERVYRARLLMPSHIPLRVFVNPEECIEADRILDEVLKGCETEKIDR